MTVATKKISHRSPSTVGGKFWKCKQRLYIEKFLDEVVKSTKKYHIWGMQFLELVLPKKPIRRNLRVFKIVKLFSAS
jgi:hypothetical protein